MNTGISRSYIAGISNRIAFRHIAAACAFVSQAIHLWILPGEIVVSIVPGLFFFGVAIGQGLLGVSLLSHPGKWVLRFGILLNIGILMVWMIVHLGSFPNLVGHNHNGVGIFEITAILAEATVALVLGKLHFVR